MPMLVTLQQASDHLRRDTSDDNADLTLKIQSVSSAILNYLKNRMLAYQFEMDDAGSPILDSSGDIVYILDSSGDYVAREEVQAAVLIMLGVLFVDRDAAAYVENSGDQARLENMSMPRTVHWLLDPIRTPSMG